MSRILFVASFVLLCACIGMVLAEEECIAVHQFLKQIGFLLKSLPVHTYPVFTLCTNGTAVREYHAATELYHNMTREPTCQKYLGHNRMNVYETIYGQLTGLWTAANCDACAGAANETDEFMAQSATLEHCLASMANPCESCDAQYQRVQQLYGELEKNQHGPDRICFDIADQMNQTRRAWSAQYNCCKDKRRSMVLFASIGSIACALPFLFYVVMHVVTVRRESRQMSLLSATSGDDVSRPSGSGVTANGGNGAQREPEMAGILETDDNVAADADSLSSADVSDGNGDDGTEIDKCRARVSSASTKENNLNLRESRLIDISPEETSQSQLLVAKNPSHDVSDDVALLH
uniref:Osteopetrosis-associated transmembrane protein 1 n=1 Tax=Anopheles dirus TaxID=7168 RepID=A0A182NAC9_9DIPT